MVTQIGALIHFEQPRAQRVIEDDVKTEALERAWPQVARARGVKTVECEFPACESGGDDGADSGQYPSLPRTLPVALGNQVRTEALRAPQMLIRCPRRAPLPPPPPLPLVKLLRPRSLLAQWDQRRLGRRAARAARRSL